MAPTRREFFTCHGTQIEEVVSSGLPTMPLTDFQTADFGNFLYPPASFLAGLPGFEVVGVALAAPVHELAAALSVPAVVETGDPGAAGPHLRGQEADLRVVP